MFHHGVQDRQQGTHRQRGPHVGAPPPARPAAPARAPIPGRRGDPDQSGQPLAAPGAQLRPVEPARAGPDRPQGGDAAPQRRALPPPGPRPPRRVEVVVQPRQARVAPGDLGLAVRRPP
jgi:hypothetical protein